MFHAPFELQSASPAFILGADAFRLDEDEAALVAAGFDCRGHALGDQGAAALGRQARIDLILIDLRGAGPQDGAAMLAAACARQDDYGADLAVRFQPDQTDGVFATLAGRQASMLCDPTPAELAGELALLVARRPGARVRETESEAERLKRLNEEVARIAEALTRLVSIEPAAPGERIGDRAGDRRPGYGAPPAADSPAVTSVMVRSVIRARRMRDQFFDGGLFADPAWDMLLDLFAAELERARVSVSSLCIAAAVPPTTALRWITTLIETGLMEREPDPQDKRRAHVKLSGQAGIAMRSYFSALAQTGLAAV